jgi:hypothetical protein
MRRLGNLAVPAGVRSRSRRRESRSAVERRIAGRRCRQTRPRKRMDLPFPARLRTQVTDPPGATPLLVSNSSVMRIASCEPCGCKHER